MIPAGMDSILKLDFYCGKTIVFSKVFKLYPPFFATEASLGGKNLYFMKRENILNSPELIIHMNKPNYKAHTDPIMIIEFNLELRDSMGRVRHTMKCPGNKIPSVSLEEIKKLSSGGYLLFTNVKAIRNEQEYHYLIDAHSVFIE